MGRAWPQHHWGSWCWRCKAWFPDEDGKKADTSQPPKFELIDATPSGTVVRPAEEGNMAKKLSKVVKQTYRCSYKNCTTIVASYGARCDKHRYLW